VGRCAWQNRVHIIVHDHKPPFLDGRVVYTKQLQTVVPIRDPTSDMAVFCRKGSQLVTERRRQREQRKVGWPPFDATPWDELS